MSLNWTQVNAQTLDPIPLPDECTLYRIGLANLEVIIPPTLSGPKSVLRATGRLWVTNKRLIFVAPTAILGACGDDASQPATTEGSAPGPASSSRPAESEGILASSVSYLSSFLPITATPSPSSSIRLDSLSIPLPSISRADFIQPVFAANYETLVFAPTQPGGGFPEGPRFIDATILFREGKAWEFVRTLDEARERYSRRRRVEEGEGLPAYPGQS